MQNNSTKHINSMELDPFRSPEMTGRQANMEHSQVDPADYGGSYNDTINSLNPEARQATENLQTTLAESVESAKQGGEYGVDAISKSLEDSSVESARSNLSKVLAESNQTEKVSDVEEKIVGHQAEQSGVVNSTKVATALVNKESTMGFQADKGILAGEQVVANGIDTNPETSQAQDARAVSENIIGRNNGAGDKVIQKMSVRVGDKLNEWGVKRKVSDEIGKQNELLTQLGTVAQAVNNSGGATKELDITQSAIEKQAEDKVIGENFVKALANPDQINDANREELAAELSKNPNDYLEVATAVGNLRRTGEISAVTARKVGSIINSIVSK